jgi:hypothetical protein
MWRARNPDNPRSVAAQNKQSTLRFVPFASSANKLDVVADFVCEIFSFAKFPFGLEPKLFIPSNWPVVLFPDFPGALSDFSSLSFAKARALCFSSAVRANNLPTAQSRGIFGLLEKAGDRLLRIRRTLFIKLDDGDLNLFSGLEGLKLALAPGTGGHICELFAENPHWRERLTRGLSLVIPADFPKSLPQCINSGISACSSELIGII